MVAVAYKRWSSTVERFDSFNFGGLVRWLHTRGGRTWSFYCMRKWHRDDCVCDRVVCGKTVRLTAEKDWPENRVVCRFTKKVGCGK